MNDGAIVNGQLLDNYSTITRQLLNNYFIMLSKYFTMLSKYFTTLSKYFTMLSNYPAIYLHQAVYILL